MMICSQCATGALIVATVQEACECGQFVVIKYEANGQVVISVKFWNNLE